MPREEAKFEELLAIHCAPVLKRKKIANMFHVTNSQFENIKQLIAKYAQKLKKYGIDFFLFQEGCCRLTVYVYQKAALLLRLHQSHIQSFLSAFSYPDSQDLNEIFRVLDQRLCQCQNYPHEIGVFLGYPLEDVKGFMEHKPCKLVGYWKVYGDAEKAENIFHQYDRYRDELLNGIYAGNRIEQLLLDY